MHALHFTDRPRAAATHLIHTTTLAFTLDGHWTDDGRLLEVDVNCDVWERLSSGERALIGVLEAMADRHSTVTMRQLAHLDPDCRAAFVRSLATYLDVEVAA